MNDHLWQLIIVAFPSLLAAGWWVVRMVGSYKDRIQKPLLKELEARGETIGQLADELKEREKNLTEERLTRMFVEAKNEALERENNILREGRGA